MAQGREFKRAIDRLVADLARIAERVIAIEIERAITLATAEVDRRSRGRTASSRASDPFSDRSSRTERAAQRRAEQEAERRERDLARHRRRMEREQLRQELLAAREASRQQRDQNRDQQRQEKAAARQAKLQEREAERAAQLAPPPLVVFKRSRDGQVTVLKPRPVEAENTVQPNV